MTGTTTDYDAPRVQATDEDSLEELKARHASVDPAVIDIDENGEHAVVIDELLDEDLSIPVVPMRADEFRCSSCFLVRHRHQRAAARSDICVDCA